MAVSVTDYSNRGVALSLFGYELQKEFTRWQ